MNRSADRRLACAALLGAALLPRALAADSAPGNALVGTWTLLRVDNLMPDGTRVQLYGPQPQGLLMFDAAGRYSLQILRGGRARFAAGDKARGTPAEYAEAVQGSNAHFGHYAIDESARTLTFHIDNASFPNWEGTTQVRRFELDGDTLVYRVPVPTTGEHAVGEVQWRRANVTPR